MSRVNVYVDGFNLYYGATNHQPYKWLDIGRFAATMLRASDEIARIRYFTAEVDGRRDRDAPIRQKTYLRALRTLPGLTIHYGRFLTTHPFMPALHGAGRVQVIKSEEKGSDVNLATYLLLDAVDDDFDTALIVSNDSDLVTPIQVTVDRFAKTVGVAMPVLNRNGDRSPRVPGELRGLLTRSATTRTSLGSKRPGLPFRTFAITHPPIRSS